MSKLLKIFATGCTGGFSDHPDLNARFVAWCVFTLMSLGAFAFDAWISYSVFADYLAYVGSSGHWPGLILSAGFALAATVSVSVIAYAFVSYRKGIGTGTKLSDSLRFAGYVAAFLYLTFATVSVLANIQGAQQAADRHASAAVPVDDSQLTYVSAEWTAEKQATTARYDNELRELKGRIIQLEAPGETAAQSGSTTILPFGKIAKHNCNETGCEQGYYDGKRGNPHWKGALTPYGRALLADLRKQVTEKEIERENALIAIDGSYQSRLDTEKDSFKRKASKHEEKRSRATTAIRLIVFLIYPIALLIAVFNAHFLYDATEAIQQGKSSSSGAPKPVNRLPAGYTHSPTPSSVTGAQIGFKMPWEESGLSSEDILPDFDTILPYFGKFKEELLEEMAGIIAQHNKTVSPVKGDNAPPVEYRFSSTHQPDRNSPKVPKKHGMRADGMEARTSILAAYRALASQGKKVTYQAISDATKYSVKTVGNHVRELKREGLVG